MDINNFIHILCRRVTEVSCEDNNPDGIEQNPSIFEVYNAPQDSINKQGEALAKLAAYDGNVRGAPNSGSDAMTASPKIRPNRTQGAASNVPFSLSNAPAQASPTIPVHNQSQYPPQEREGRIL
ncbi:hypothetical protein SK128_018533, partial [Halocaridina rubra]